MRSLWNIAALFAYNSGAALTSHPQNETGAEGWLRYVARPTCERHDRPRSIVVLDEQPNSPVHTAQHELRQGFLGMFGLTLNILDASLACDPKGQIVVGTLDRYTELCGPYIPPILLKEDGFWLSSSPDGRAMVIGENDRGVLYGAFEYLSRLAAGNGTMTETVDNPTQNIRWVNQWDNMDGSIERGYGGRSIVFANGTPRRDLDRVAEYGRLLASIRFNGLIINNVNANETTISDDNIEGLGQIADRLRPYGIRMGISVNFASPQTLGGLPSYDPLENGVIQWWQDRTDRLYTRIPDMAGYNVKADSEGQPGPLAYNRTFAEGANMFARALAPYNGIVTFRAFVYTPQAWDDWRADRAKESTDYFAPLDGQFDDNVVLQIKYGPIDFQVQEPPSPLFAQLDHSNMALEIQVAQEYTGQGSHFVYLPPLWRTILDFDMRKHNRRSVVSDLISGKVTGRRLGGLVAVVNVGDSDTWMGSHLATSNLYASGRLAWNANQSSEMLFRDWATLTFGGRAELTDTLWKMAADSWPAYLNYTGVLGTLSPNAAFTHYGPGPDSADGPSGSRWFRAYTGSIGMDRTSVNGTGCSVQYPSEVASKFEHVNTTPKEYLLWFHHLPYTHVLSTGDTLIQYIYDGHYNGAQRAQEFPLQWRALESDIDRRRFSEVLYQLEYQAGHAIVWRDAMVDWYHNKTLIPDERGRVGRHPYRIEGEDMLMDGYEVVLVRPPEAASGSKAVATISDTVSGRLSCALHRIESGHYDLAINHFDLQDAVSKYTVYINGNVIARFAGDGESTLFHEFSPYIDGHSAVRRTVRHICVTQGDLLVVEGHPVSGEAAPIDYISFIPEGSIVD